MDSEFYLQLAEPLVGDAPAGIDASGEDEFEVLNTELAKASGVDAKVLDWAKIEKNSVTILSTQSKDLRVAGYLVIALYEQQGFAGLAIGLQLYAAIVNADYWDDIYPKRKKKPNKARAASFKWTVTRIERVLSTLEVSKDSDFAGLLAVANAFSQADNALYDRLEDDAPDTNDVKNRFKRIALEAQAGLDEATAAAAPAVVEPPVEEPKPTLTERAKDVVKSVKEAITPTPAPVPVEAIKVEAPITKVGKADIEKALDASRKTMEAVVTALRDSAPYDPWAFYLSRTAKWMTLDGLPPNEIMPQNPTEQQMADLVAMASNKHYETLIEDAEKWFSQGAIFNITLQRLVANALDALTTPVANEASQMVKNCVGQLLQRLPGLLDLNFNNKQPFVDDLTKTWLDNSGVLNGEGKRSGKNSGKNTSQSNGVDVTNTPAPWLDGLTEAQTLLSGGNFDGGIGILANGIAAASGLREKTFWQLAQARFCDSANHLDLALSQLQYLEKFVNDSVLAQWEPQLRVEIITELLQCHMKKMAKTTYTAEQKLALAPLYSELSLQAPVVALSINIS